MCLAVVSPAFGQHDHRPPVVSAGDAVHVETTCKPTVTGMFDRGVGLLHAFSFTAALDAFRLVAHSDVDCTMAFWGTALANWGVWHTTGSEAALIAGRRALESARHTRHGSAREHAYLEAVAIRFAGVPGDPFGAGQAYERAMARLSASYPDDLDAALFGALALIERPERRLEDVRANRQRAWATLRARSATPHPGLAHYLILAADGPEAAAAALDAANGLATLVTATPYTLHVPSHIYAALGQWDRAIDANLQSADAARQRGLAADELHALDTLTYALLQAGRQDEAVAIARRVTAAYGRTAEAGTRALDAHMAAAAIPARVAIERGDWAAASQLPLPPSPGPAMTLTRLARALGSARLGRHAEARAALPVLGPRDGEFTSLEHTVLAWTQLAEGRPTEAVTSLEQAVQLQASIGPIDLAFGYLVPPREALGELLLEVGRPADARAAFERALLDTPNRRRTLEGTATAAGRIRGR